MVVSGVEPTIFTSEICAALDKHGINPSLAKAKLSPFVELLTSSVIDEAMTATTWSPNAGGGARLIHLLKYLENQQNNQLVADERMAQRMQMAKQDASRMAYAVRVRVDALGMAPWIAMWAYSLTQGEYQNMAVRALEYIATYGNPDIRTVVKQKYADPLEADWLRALAWDDTRPGPLRSIIGALSTQ